MVHQGCGSSNPRAAAALGLCHELGDGVDRDEEKALDYLKRAAELGEAYAYFYIGIILRKRWEIEDAMLNYRKAAMCGVCDAALFGRLRNGYGSCFITKEEYLFTLRELSDAVDSMKSQAREEAKKFREQNVK